MFYCSIMFGVIVEGKMVICYFLCVDDCFGIIKVFKVLGVKIEEIEEEIIVYGIGFDGLK